MMGLELGEMTYHLSLFLAVKEVVVVLHRNKLVPSVLLSNILQCLELPRRHLFRISTGAHAITMPSNRHAG
jgi:hypothetical protein